MKITRSQLKKIIKEELQRLDEIPGDPGLTAGGPAVKWVLPAGARGCITLSKDEKHLFLQVGGDCEGKEVGGETVPIKITSDEGMTVVADLKVGVQDAVQKHYDWLDIEKYVPARTKTPIVFKNSGAECRSGQIKSIVIDMTEWTESLYNDVIKVLDEEIKPHDISYKLMSSICEKLVHDEIPYSTKHKDYAAVWGTLPKDQTFTFGYTVEWPGKAIFNSRMVMHNAESPPKSYDKSLITSRVQAHLDKFAWLKIPEIKLEVEIIRYKAGMKEGRQMKITRSQLKKMIEANSPATNNKNS